MVGAQEGVMAKDLVVDLATVPTNVRVLNGARTA